MVIVRFPPPEKKLVAVGKCVRDLAPEMRP